MLAKLSAFALIGIEATPVEVEVDVAAGLPKTILVGLPEMAVADEAAYEERAVALATDPGELARLRDHLWDERANLPLFDNARFTGELAALFARMAARWQQGLPPEALPAA